MARQADETIDVLVRLRDELSRPAATVTRNIDKIKRAATEATPAVDAFGDQIEDAGRQAAKGAVGINANTRAIEKNTKAALKNRAATNDVGVEAQKTATANRRLGDAIDRVTGSPGSSSGRGSKGRGLFGMLSASMNLRGFFKVALIPTILDAIGVLATLGSAAGAAGAAAVGGLAPLTGLLVAYPTYLSAIVQGFAVFKLGMRGVGDALSAAFGNDPKAYAQAMAKLGPEAVKLVNALRGFQGPLQFISRQIQKEMLPGFTALVNSAKSYLPLLRTVGQETGRVFGRVANGIENYIDRDSTRGKVRSITKNNTSILNAFGSMGTSGVKALINVMVAAGPMISRLTWDMSRLFDRIANMSDNGKGLRDFFESTYRVTKKVTGVLADVGKGLYNIFKLGTGLGSQMGDSFIEMADTFRLWTQSGDGQASIKKWFEDMTPIIYEVGRLIADIGKGLGKISMDPTVFSTLQMLRTEVLPELLRLIESASGRFIPSLVKAGTAILNIITDVMVVPNVLDMIAGALSVISDVIHALPGPLRTVLGLLVTISSLLKVKAMLGFFTHLGGGAAGGAVSGMLGLGGLRGAGGRANHDRQVMSRAARIGGAGRGMAGLAGMGAGLASLGGAAAGALPAVAIAAVAAFGWAVHNSASNLDELDQSVKDLGTSLNTTSSTSALAALRDKQKGIYGQIQDKASHNYFSQFTDTDTYGDIARIVGHGLNPFAWGNPLELSMDRQQAAAEAAKEEERKYLRTTFSVANNVYGSEYSDATQEQIDKTRALAEVMNLDLSKGVDAASAAMKEYIWLNEKASNGTREFSAAVKDFYEVGATATDRISAMARMMAALMPSGLSETLNRAQFTKDTREGLRGQVSGAAGFFKTGRSAFTERDALNPNRQALMQGVQGRAEALLQLAQDTYARTGDKDAALAIYTKGYTQVQNELAFGYNKKGGFDKSTSISKSRSLMMDAFVNPEQLNAALDNPNSVAAQLNSGRELSTVLAEMTSKPYQIQIDLQTRINGALADFSPFLASIANMMGIQIPTTAASIFPQFLRRDGGPVFPGPLFTVGEEGFEGFLSKSGKLDIIGMSGQQQMKFKEPGVVLPHDMMKRAMRQSQQAATPQMQAISVSLHGNVNARDEAQAERVIARGVVKGLQLAKEREL